MLGNFAQKIYRAAGHEVIGINYLGDWGVQFGLLLTHWPDYFQKHELQNRWTSLTPESKVMEYTKAYVEANQRSKTDSDFYEAAKQYFKGMEDHLMATSSFDEFKLWNEFKQVSIEYLKEFYQRMNVSFDEWDAESKYVVDGKHIVDTIMKNGDAFLTKDGLWAVHNPQNGGYAPLKKSDNSSLYLTR